MSPNPLDAMALPPFQFRPDPLPIEGPAFSPVFKLLASVLVFGVIAWMARLWLDGKVSGGGTSILTWFIAALAMMVYTWWWIVRSVTRLDTQHLHQSWVWNKDVELRELAYGKLIRVRGLEWLVAPRLYVRTLLGKFAVFHAADPRMIAQFERLVAELKTFRDFK